MAIILPASDAPRDALIVPDEHYYPEDDFRRCEWLGEYIMDTMPAVIVRLGDCWDMPSLCSFEKGKKEFMFQSVQGDIESGHHAEALIFGPMLKYNNTQSKYKKKKYTPLVIKLIGNHEYRVKRLLEYEPRWEGSVSMKNFNTRLDIDETVVDYTDFIIVDDIAYAHFFVSGTQGRAYSSARAMLMKKGMSCTMGHTHIFDYATITKPTGEDCKALIAGSFHDPKHEGFGGKQVDAVWRNLIVHKHDVLRGNYDLEELSIDRLERKYSSKTDNLFLKKIG